MGAQGTSTIDFGASLISEATIAVIGQATILAASACEAWIMEQTTGDNGPTAHEALHFLSKVYCKTVVAGTGFTIHAMMTEGVATGQFTVNWVWN